MSVHTISVKQNSVAKFSYCTGKMKDVYLRILEVIRFNPREENELSSILLTLNYLSWMM
jgi:hypothetical protein